MTETFADTGLRPELIEAARSIGYTSPTTLQRAAIPVLRRGGNAVLHASSGAGVTAAFGLPLFDRLLESESDPRPAALVLAATPEVAARVARALSQLSIHTGVRVHAPGGGWAAAESAHVLVIPASAALDALRDSSLKLEHIKTLVIVDFSTAVALGAREALDTLITSVPREAQRVVITSDVNKDVTDFVERHARRALSIPSRAASPGHGAHQATQTVTVEYGIASQSDKIDLVAAIISSAKQPPILTARTDNAAAALAETLTLRGFRIGAIGETGIDAVVVAVDTELSGAWPLSYDVPFDSETMSTRHADGGIVLVTPSELSHLRRIAGEAGIALRPLPAHAEAATPLEQFRDRLRAALAQEDLDPQILLLAPLLEKHSALEIAAAATALLRKREPVAAPATTGSAPRMQAASTTGAPRSFVRLFVGLGEKDDVRPGDLVGAIAGEAGIPGEEVGKIEIRDTFSVVEVPSELAERVIKALNGTTLKGRSVRVDYDRKPMGGQGARAARSDADASNRPRTPGGPRGAGGPPGRGPGGGGKGPRGPRNGPGGPRSGPGGPRSGPGGPRSGPGGPRGGPRSPTRGGRS
jgi:ATP-dependent RNA helicase DeaD